MPEFVVIRPKTSFRRGLGAASVGSPYVSGVRPISITRTVALPSTPTVPASSSSTAPPPWLSLRRPMPDYQLAYGGSPIQAPRTASSSSTSQTASAATMAAFNAALASAVSYGVISTQGAAALQAQASGASDASVQSLTAQINQLMASTPSAASVAAGSTAASTAAAVAPTTSWWDGTTTLFGSSISNPLLVVGAGLAAVGIWAAFKKK